MDQSNERGEGLKYDGGKPRFALIRFGCARALEGIATVLSYGAKKYKAHSWKEVENNRERYWDAMERHMNKIGLGEDVDEESGLPHIHHVATNALFLAELYEMKREKDETLYKIEDLVGLPPRQQEVFMVNE